MAPGAERPRRRRNRMRDGHRRFLRRLNASTVGKGRTPATSDVGRRNRHGSSRIAGTGFCIQSAGGIGLRGCRTALRRARRGPCGRIRGTCRRRLSAVSGGHPSGLRPDKKGTQRECGGTCPCGFTALAAMVIRHSVTPAKYREDILALKAAITATPTATPIAAPRRNMRVQLGFSTLPAKPGINRLAWA